MPKEVVLDIKPKERRWKVYLPWVVALVIIAGLFFGSGFGAGRYTKASLPFFEEETPTKSATREGWYVHQSNGFSLEYPKGWKIEINSEEEARGAKVLGDGGKIEFWFDTIKVFKFTAEQSKNREKSATSELEIDGRKAQVSLFPYKSGDIFIEVKLPAAKNKEKILFWLNAANENFKETLLEILTTFKTADETTEEENE